MNTVMESVLTVCVVLISTELLRNFCPENHMVRFVGSLVALSVLISTVGTLLSVDVDFSLAGEQTQNQQEELTSYVEEQYEQAAQQDWEEYIKGLLATAGIEAKEIRVLTDRNEEGSIVLTEVTAVFQYSTEEERARALFQNVLGEGIRVTVEAES